MFKSPFTSAAGLVVAVFALVTSSVIAAPMPTKSTRQ